MRSSARLAMLEGWPRHVGEATIRISAETIAALIRGHSSPASDGSNPRLAA